MQYRQPVKGAMLLGKVIKVQTQNIYPFKSMQLKYFYNVKQEMKDMKLSL